MNEVTKLYENANIKPEYRYDCNLADTIKPEEVFPLHRCSKGEIKDYCTNKQDYRYCKVYKVNKIYPPFTAEKQIKIIEWLGNSKAFFDANETIFSLITNHKDKNGVLRGYEGKGNSVDSCLAGLINNLWQDLTDAEKAEIKNILEM